MEYDVAAARQRDAVEAEACQTLFFKDGEVNGHRCRISRVNYMTILWAAGTAAQREFSTVRALLAAYGAAEIETALCRMFRSINWRVHNVACAAVVSGFSSKPVIDALWLRLSEYSWSSPQIAATAALVDPDFPNKALALLADAATPPKSVVSLGELLQIRFNRGPVAGSPEEANLAHARTLDRDNAGRIATRWLNRVTSTLCAELPSDDLHIPLAYGTIRPDADLSALRLRWQQQAQFRQARDMVLGLTALDRDNARRWYAERAPKTTHFFQRDPCLDLIGIDVAGLTLAKIDFSGSRLDYAMLAGSMLSDCQFQEAFAPFADFSHSRISAGQMSPIYATRASFRESVLDKCYLMGTAPVSHSKWSNSDLSECDFSKATINGCDFERCDLRWADFSGALIKDCNFSSSDLRGLKTDSTTVFMRCRFAFAIVDEDSYFVKRIMEDQNGELDRMIKISSR